MAETKSKTTTKVTKEAKPVKAKAVKKEEAKTEIVAEVVDTEVVEEASSEVEEKAEEAETKAKAGKRSAKALKETAEKVAKEERKASADEPAAEVKAKSTQKAPRTHLERKGKKYRKLIIDIDKTKTYPLKDALELAIKTSPTKFDATVEFHARLGVDPKHADQNIRGTVILPAGSGKKIKVAVYADGADIEAAKKAGADIAMAQELLQQFEKGTIDFDILITTSALMPSLSKYARLLGPKGLMPNPKAGTVTNDVPKAVKEAKAGKVEYRIDTNGIVHLGVGKVSFGADKLVENAEAVISSLKQNKPASIKGNYVKSIFVSTTMGPSIELDKSVI
jgi:large subunit ribosomal protein L1